MFMTDDEDGFGNDQRWQCRKCDLLVEEFDVCPRCEPQSGHCALCTDRFGALPLVTDDGWRCCSEACRRGLESEAA